MLLDTVKDRPLAGAVLVVAGVGIHRALYGTVSLLPDVPKAVADATTIAVPIYLAFAGVVAIVAGFAGVVVVFALGQHTENFVILRRRGGRQLRANWSSPIATSFVAAFGCVATALLAVAGHGFAAWWIFEALFLLAATAAARLVWLFRGLATIVDSHDADALTRHEQSNTVDIATRIRSS